MQNPLTHTYDPDKPTTYTPSSSTDWQWEFKKAIEDQRYGVASAECYTDYEKGRLTVYATIKVYPDEEQHDYGTMVNFVRSAYNKVAKKCPESSTLKIKKEYK